MSFFWPLLELFMHSILVSLQFIMHFGSKFLSLIYTRYTKSLMQLLPRFKILQNLEVWTKPKSLWFSYCLCRKYVHQNTSAFLALCYWKLSEDRQDYSRIQSPFWFCLYTYCPHMIVSWSYRLHMLPWWSLHTSLMTCSQMNMLGQWMLLEYNNYDNELGG